MGLRHHQYTSVVSQPVITRTDCQNQRYWATGTQKSELSPFRLKDCPSEPDSIQKITLKNNIIQLIFETNSIITPLKPKLEIALQKTISWVSWTLGLKGSQIKMSKKRIVPKEKWLYICWGLVEFLASRCRCIKPWCLWKEHKGLYYHSNTSVVVGVM